MRFMPEHAYKIRVGDTILASAPVLTYFPNDGRELPGEHMHAVDVAEVAECEDNGEDVTIRFRYMSMYKVLLTGEFSTSRRNAVMLATRL